jgi:hypothetical protein
MPPQRQGLESGKRLRPRGQIHGKVRRRRSRRLNPSLTCSWATLAQMKGEVRGSWEFRAIVALAMVAMASLQPSEAMAFQTSRPRLLPRPPWRQRVSYHAAASPYSRSIIHFHGLEEALCYPPVDGRVTPWLDSVALFLSGAGSYRVASRGISISYAATPRECDLLGALSSAPHPGIPS